MSNQNKGINKKTEKEQQKPRPTVHRRGPMAMMKGEKASDFKGTMKQLISYLGKYNLLILIVLTIAAASTVFAILGPRILGQATTLLFEGVVAQISGAGSGIERRSRILCGSGTV